MMLTLFWCEPTEFSRWCYAWFRSKLRSNCDFCEGLTVTSVIVIASSEPQLLSGHFVLGKEIFTKLRTYLRTVISAPTWTSAGSELPICPQSFFGAAVSWSLDSGRYFFNRIESLSDAGRAVERFWLSISCVFAAALKAAAQRPESQSRHFSWLYWLNPKCHISPVSVQIRGQTYWVWQMPFRPQGFLPPDLRRCDSDWKPFTFWEASGRRSPPRTQGAIGTLLNSLRFASRAVVTLCAAKWRVLARPFASNQASQ